MTKGQHQRIHIRVDEILRRQVSVRKLLHEHSLDALCLFGSTWIYYFTGFAFQPTERPICLIILADGDSIILVPDLEREHAELASQTIGGVWTYPEYPGERHPMSYFEALMKKRKLDRARIGFDSNSYGGYWGSEGPTLSELLPEATLRSLLPQLRRMRAIKSPSEINALRESARFGNLAHEILIDTVTAGESELILSMRASAEASAVMLKAFSGGYAVTQWGSAPVHVGIKAGPETAWPHPMGGGRSIRVGDIVNTWSLVALDGYRAELERTLFLGEPNMEQERGFMEMFELQQFALSAIRPGRRCCDVERDVVEFARQHGIVESLRHHTGHSLGLESHEPPFLDLGDQTVLAPGMVFSVEPGIYKPGLGGFRHSDTVVVTEDGIEVLTYAPKALEDVLVTVRKA